MSRSRLVYPFLLALAWQAPAWAGFEQAVAAYERGDFGAALAEFQALAGEGHVSAMFNLGNMYRKGEGVEPDAKLAADYYRGAAERGHAKAQNSLGVMYATGTGLQANDLEAFAWFTIAAMQGDAEAQKNAQRAESLLTPERLSIGRQIVSRYYQAYVAPYQR